MTETQELIRHLGMLSYLDIFGVSILANIVIPVPEEAVILAFGYLAGTGRVNGLILIPIVIAGLLTSDIVMYALSKRGNRLILFFYKKFFSKRLERRRAWLESHVEKVIFFSRFMVQLRFLGPFFAGQTRVPLKRFLKYELAALILYVPFFIWVGFYFRNRVEAIVSGINTARNIILIIAGIAIILSLLGALRRFAFKIPEPKD